MEIALVHQVSLLRFVCRVEVSNTLMRHLRTAQIYRCSYRIVLRSSWVVMLEIE